MASLRLRTDALGYVLGGESVDGFSDDESLSFDQRLRIAVWAERFTPEDITESQRALLARRPARQSSERQRQLAANRDDIADLGTSGLWSALTEEEQKWVAQPGTHPKLPDETGYPLTMGELEQLTGATQRQLRWWIDKGLVPGMLDGRRRLVYSAGAAHALLQSRVGQPEKTLIGGVLEGKTATFLQLLAESLRAWSDNLGELARREVEATCTGLARTAQCMADPEKFESDIAAKVAESVSYDQVLQSFLHELAGSPQKKDDVSSPALKLLVELKQRHERDPGDLPKTLTVSFADEGIGALLEESVSDVPLSLDSGHIHTVPLGEKIWANVRHGEAKILDVAPTKAAAEARAKEVATAEEAIHVIHKKDGTIHETKPYTSPVVQTPKGMMVSIGRGLGKTEIRKITTKDDRVFLEVVPLKRSRVSSRGRAIKFRTKRVW